MKCKYEAKMRKPFIQVEEYRMKLENKLIDQQVSRDDQK